MMAARRIRTDLAERLPRVRGRYDVMADLGRMTWFRVGGPAEVLFAPADTEDLAHFLKGKPEDVPLSVVGLGSNMLVRDGGVPGVVVHLGKPFSTISVDGFTLKCGAGAVDATVANAARDAAITGLEFLTSIPGTIGGALRMNAGAYGREMTNVVVEAYAIDPTGLMRTPTPADLGFTYRHSAVPADWIFTGATLQGEAGSPDAIQARMDEIQAVRAETQPLRTPTGGSTFKNPEGHKAWQLIDAAGCRGLRKGGAQVSELHCNFLINVGGATAGDIEALGEDVRRRVFAQSGVTLEWEIKRIGKALPGLHTVGGAA